MSHVKRALDALASIEVANPARRYAPVTDSEMPVEMMLMLLKHSPADRVSLLTGWLASALHVYGCDEDCNAEVEVRSDFYSLLKRYPTRGGKGG